MLVVVSALLLSLLIKTFFFQSFYIPSPSMEPTLLEGDRILVTKWRPEPLPLRRGDVVVFKDPAQWLGPPAADESGLRRVAKDVLTWTGLLPEDAGEHLVKRVVGLPGDVVECTDAGGAVSVNGIPLDESYVADGARACGIEFRVEVPQGYLWVMGDNRDDSADSRAHLGDPGGGTVPVANVVGTTFAVVWPFDHFGGVGNPFEDQAAVDAVAALTRAPATASSS